MATQLEQTFTTDKNQLLANEAQRIFGELIQSGQRVGDVFSISYEHAIVQIHDKHRQDVGGIPGLCFLIATRVNLASPINYEQEDASIILLRVMDSSPLPNEKEIERIRVQVAQNVSGTDVNWDQHEAMDPVTANLFSFAGVKCRVIGTFYLDKGAEANKQPSLVLKFGCDLSNYYPNQGLKVYKPNGQALSRIVNYRDPERLAEEISTAMVEIGDVRYASTNRSFQGVSDVPVSILPADLLSQKTALFGMTRTGKSNTTKVIIKSVFDLRYEKVKPLRIGQLVFDANGEYANEHTQDATGGRVAAAIKNLRDSRPIAKPEDVITYGITAHNNDPQRKLMLLNFYHEDNLKTGKSIIDQLLESTGISSIYVRNFMQVQFERPDSSDQSAIIRYKRRVFCYRALLKKAGLTPPSYLQPDIKGLFKKELLEAMANINPPIQASSPASTTATKKFQPKLNEGKNSHLHAAAARIIQQGPITWDQAAQFCEALANFIDDSKSGFDVFNAWYMEHGSSSKEAWADAGLEKILAMFNYDNGPRLVGKAARQHTHTTSGDYTEEIYKDLVGGRLVIVDQSSGDEDINQANAARLMDRIFRKNQQVFREGKTPPDILIYVEEAHTILPADSEKDLTNIWVKTAKEGGKYHLGLVYATQEVSSIQRNILKNTANFFIGHLNNTDETRELCKYYDFEDFESSIRRAQDKGFLRVKTLSNYFVVPIQVKRFSV